MKNALLRNIFFAVFSILLCDKNYAQDCTDANVAGLPGKWKLLPGSFFNQSKADVLKEKPVADEVIESIRKYLPWSIVGGDISYETCGLHNDARPISISNICNLFDAEIYFEPYYCNAGKITHGSGISSLTTRFNGLLFDFGYSLYTPGPNDTQGDKDPGIDRYAVLRWLPEVKDGYFDYIQDNVDGTGNTPGKIYRYRTIFKPGKLPYSLMSKKEFYEKWKILHQIEITKIEADKVKFSKDTALSGSPYLSQTLELFDQNIGLYKNYINKIDGFLKTRSAEELSQPAFEGEQLGEYFESRQAPGYLRSYIVKLNVAYFNNKLPKSSPQIITIIQQYGLDIDDNGNKHYSDENFYKALEKMKIFDFLTEKLKPLIVQ